MFIFNPFSFNNDQSKKFTKEINLKVLRVLCRCCAEEVSFEW